MTQHTHLETDGTKLVTLEARRQAVRTELFYMPNDGNQAQNYTCFTVCAIPSDTDGTNLH